MARGIPESLAVLDGATIVEAASRAVVLWPPSPMQDEEHVEPPMPPMPRMNRSSMVGWFARVKRPGAGAPMDRWADRIPILHCPLIRRVSSREGLRRGWRRFQCQCGTPVRIATSHRPRPHPVWVRREDEMPNEREAAAGGAER
jgi:hypothetical protein